MYTPTVKTRDQPPGEAGVTELNVDASLQKTPTGFTSLSDKVPDHNEHITARASDHSTSSDDSSESVRKEATESDHQRVFDRAAYLLRQACDLREPGGGGVVLFDTNAQASSLDPLLKRQDSEYDDTRRPDCNRQRSDASFYSYPSPSINQTACSGAMRERVVLAAASIQPGDRNEPPKNIGRADPKFKVTLGPPELKRMCSKYPRGKLFNIPKECGTSLFDREGRPVASRLSTRMFDLVLLRRQFPNARQVIFIPMFHANLNRWTSCFVYTNSRYRVFSYEMDYLPVLAFCNSIKAEIVRLATVFADRQKNDFIGSVSHELRSP